MSKKNIVSICYAAIIVSALMFSGACVPKKPSPSDDEVLHRTTQAALENSAVTDDDDEDGAWEPDTVVDQSRRTKYLAKNYSRNHEAGTGSTGDLLKKARTALGTPYVPGGTSRSGGFDCSGFVQWSYNHVGIQLPRTAREQSQVGRPVRRVGDIQAGDIVAFRHPRRGYHTGIYVGDGKFIHSPRKRNVVRINSLDDPYFSSTFMGARRLNVSNEGDIEAAEKMLAAYASQPPSPKNTVSRSSKKDKKSSARASARNSKNEKSKARASRPEKKSKVETVALRTDKAAKLEKSDKKTSSAKKTTTSKESKAKASTSKTNASKASTAQDKKSSKNSSKKNEKNKS